MPRRQAVFYATSASLVTLFLVVCALATGRGGVWIAAGAAAIVAACAIVEVSRLPYGE
jgi:hypothetical protein